MTIRNARMPMGLQIGIAALILVGCRSPQRVTSAQENKNSDAAVKQDELKQISETALGKQTEILAHGDLARNGLEQLLVVNRLEESSGNSDAAEYKSEIHVTRAAIVENDHGKWSEVLLCDEHLKNPKGYLGGSPTARVSGWRLAYTVDAKQGLEMKFTPAGVGAGRRESDTGASAGETVVVRWNATAKLYQSLDRSHERFLTEAPTLETPPSILK